MMDFSTILKLIESYGTITIFRHIRPDGDAVGSQLGLKEWIKHNYPNKEVYAIGDELFDAYPFVDTVSDEKIKNSLAIILDTSTKERVDSDRWMLAKESVKVDHHPPVDNFADYNFVKEDAAATCEYIVLILDTFDKEMPYAAAKYFYSGLLTDTLNFKTASVTKDTIKAAYILAQSDIPLYDITEYIFKQSLNIYNFRTYLRTKINYIDGLAYVIFDESDYVMFNISDSEARFQVAEMNGVEDYKVWCIFTKNDQGLYDGSIRSKKGYIINEIASNYNGGGHANAAGVKNLTANDLDNILKDLVNVIKEST